MAGSNTRNVVTGLVILVAFAIAVYIGINAQKGLPGASETLVSAAFTDDGGIRPGDDVRIARNRVGQVKSVSLENGLAVTVLSLQGQYSVYKDASAVLDSRSALGQKIVDLNPGTPRSGPLGDATIAPARTQPAQNLSDLFSVFDQPTRTALSSTLQQTGNGLVGHQGDLSDLLKTAPQLLPDLGTVSRDLDADHGADLTAMLRAGDSLASRFQGRTQQIADLEADMSTTLRSLDTDQGDSVRRTLDKAPATLQAAQTALADVQPPLADLASATGKLRPGAQGLGDATPDLRGTLREAVSPLNKLPDVSDDAKPAVSGLTDAMKAAQPLAPRAAEALRHADPFLTTFSPYSSDIGLFFENFAAALANGPRGKGDPDQRWLRVTLIPGLESVDGQPGLPRDPFVNREPYPAPGQAAKDSTGSRTTLAKGGK